MRQLKEIHPDYADSVDILAVGIDPSEDASDILSYKDSHGFIWPMTTADVEMLKAYGVTRQAAHMTLDASGVIVSELSTKAEKEEGWRELLEALSGS